MNLTHYALQRFFMLVALAGGVSGGLGCTQVRAPVGSEENPIQFMMVPSVDAKMLNDRAIKVKQVLEAQTPHKFRFVIPTSYVAVIEAFGSERADVAALNTFGYIVANERYGAQARLIIQRHGSTEYQSQIIARTDGPVQSLQDISGKRVAYVDPSSTSGYLMPAGLFADNSIVPSETVFAQGHQNVVTMVYQGSVDAGATFYSPPSDGKIQDARRLVVTQFPDIEEKVKIVHLTSPIPNDPIAFRKGLTEEMVEQITTVLREYMMTPEGKQVFYDLYGATGLVSTTDVAYNGVREMLKSLGKSASDLAKK